MATDQLQATIEQVQRLSFAERLQLIKYLADNLAASATPEPTPREPRQLIYGEFRDSGVGRISTEEDFKCAEWNPTEGELDEY